VASTQDDVVVRLRLKDVKQFIADVKSGKLAIDDLEKKVKSAGQTASREVSSSGGLGKLASHFGFLAGWAKTGALALGAATVGVAAYAVKSAASMQQVAVSMETMLGSAARARSMMTMLQTFARDTPFEFGDVAKQAQHLLAFGFAANSVKGTLTAVGNAASGLGLGAEGMDRIVTSLGQMRMKGRVQGDEMLQLAEAGINANAYLERAFHMTPAQLQKAQQAGKISAAAAIPVILKGMDDQFRGLMEKQSHTLAGVWSNLHDSIQQGLVRLTNPFLPTLTRWVGQVSDYLGGKKGQPGFFDRLGKFAPYLAQNVTSGRADFAAYNIGAIIGTHKFDPGIEKGVRVVHNLGVIVKDIIVPALKDLSVVLAPVGFALDHLDSVTGFIVDHKDAFGAATVGILAMVGALKVYSGIMGTVAVIQGIVDATNPFILIGAAVIGIGAALWYAYNHSKTFRDFVNGVWADIQTIWAWIRDNWSTIGPWLTAPFAIAAKTIATIADGIVAAWNNTVGRLGGPQIATSDGSQPGGGGGVGSWLSGALGFLNPGGFIGGTIGGAVADRVNTHQASGGTTVSPGLSWVGERGPELLAMPRGAQVIPLPRVPELAGGRHIEIPVVLNGREIARAVYDDMDDRMARR
jgi:tape measure domain-containing protein